MNKRSPFCSVVVTVLLLCLIALPIHPLNAAVLGVGDKGSDGSSMTTREIIKSSMSFSCMEWRFIGVCVWLTCTMFGCTTSTSAKYGHFTPDVVVSSYAMTGKNPWKDAKVVDEEISDTIADAVSEMLTSITSTEKVNPQGMSTLQAANNPSKKPTSMKFFNVDVIGHPANLSDVAGDMALCSRTTMGFMPYVQSVDWDAAMWRTGGLETIEHFLESHTFGLREIMNASGVWGNVYPRQAYIAQPDDRKAAAVIAQRGADIAYSLGTAHVYVPIGRQTGNGNWSGWGMIESDNKNHKWQALYPKASNVCSVFPNPELETTPTDTQNGYVWALWRPYSCCQKSGQRLIYNPPDGYHRGP
jgi:integrating conjugative element protein (TIGR03756 family)